GRKIMQATQADVFPAQALHLRDRPLGYRLVHQIVRFSRTKPLGAISAAIILVMVFAAAFAPIVAPQDYQRVNARQKLQGPSAAPWFGTDPLGRDLYSRIVYGARVSLFVGFVGTFLGVGVGSLIGLLAGYFGGKVDMVLMRFSDAVQAFPGLILALAIVA